MSVFSNHPLLQAGRRLLSDIGALTDDDVEVLELLRLENTASVLCTQLKALSGVDAYNADAAAKTQEQSYTRYEDLPPLNPEERERLKQYFLTLFDARRLKHKTVDAPRISGQPKTQH
jgi:hypothetical protein